MQRLNAISGNHPFPLTHALETYKSMISLSMLGFKTIILCNAAGLIATIVCVAHMAVARSALAFIFVIYIFGLLCSTLALFASYLTQLRIFNESRQSIYGGNATEYHVIWLNAALVLTALSILSFFGGSSGIAFMLNNWSN